MMQDIKNRVILSLDASTVAIGWALMDYNAVIAHGVQKLSGEFIERLHWAHYWLCTMIGQHSSVRWVAIEKPVMYKNAQTTIRLANLGGSLMASTAGSEVSIIEINPGARLAALGLPIKTPRKWAKVQVVQYVNAMFDLSLGPAEHDAADAIAIGVAAFRKMIQDFNIETIDKPEKA